MNILVTGGAGYIGSHACKALAGAGYHPVAYDNLATGHKELARWGSFVQGDILDLPLLVRTIQNYEINGIIHFAALSLVGESLLRPAEYYRNNISGTRNILDAMRRCGIRDIVVSSSCAVYGVPETIPITEDCPVSPVNPYGTTKALMESMLQDYSRAYGLRGVALRYFNAAGCDPAGESGEWHEPETHLIPRVIMAARREIPALQIYGSDYPTKDGTCIRDFIHVCDLADAHVKALALCGEIKGMLALNLGTGHGFSVRDIIDAAGDVLEAPVPLEWHGRREGDPPQLIADASRAQRMLRWGPKASGIKNLIATAASWRNTLQRLAAQKRPG